MSDLDQAARDAVALATLLADAKERGATWEESLVFARERTAEHGADLLMAQTHLLLQALQTLRDVVNDLPDDVPVIGIATPTTTRALLEEFGRSIVEDTQPPQ